MNAILKNCARNTDWIRKQKFPARCVGHVKVKKVRGKNKLELMCSCHTARKFEGIALKLVDAKIAKPVKYEDKKDVDGKVREHVCIYEIEIGDWGDTSIYVRWWYSLSNDRASIQMSHEALDALLESVTVMGLMMQLGQKVNKNGHGVNIEDLKGVVMKAIKKLGVEEDIEIKP